MHRTSAPHPASDGSRLVQVLHHLGMADDTSLADDIAPRLAGLIDLSDSITIARSHRSQGADRSLGSPQSAAALVAQVMTAQAAMIRAVLTSFQLTASPATRLPAPQAPPWPDPTAAFQPYRAFYRTQQQRLHNQVHRLQADIRARGSVLSPEIRQLCAMDAALDTALNRSYRAYMTTVPNLLEKHFARTVCADPALWASSLARFCHDMRQLLLAEIETRLLPVTGLVTAITERIDTSPDE